MPLCNTVLLWVDSRFVRPINEQGAGQRAAGQRRYCSGQVAVFGIRRPDSSHTCAPFTRSRGGVIPRSSRYGRPDGQLPGTLQRSSREAQELYLEAYGGAVQAYGVGDQADRTAYAALKAKFEKRGDHWVPKQDPPASQ